MPKKSKKERGGLEAIRKALVDTELATPKYMPADKSAFLKKMKNRMYGHQSIRLGPRGDIAVVVLTAFELELLINLAGGA